MAMITTRDERQTVESSAGQISFEAQTRTGVGKKFRLVREEWPAKRAGGLIAPPIVIERRVPIASWAERHARILAAASGKEQNSRSKVVWPAVSSSGASLRLVRNPVG